MMDDGWHKPEVNRNSVWRAYVDEFETGHAAGLLQEMAQNSFDAYPPGTKMKDTRIVIRYDADARVLMWRDYDTRGMPHCGECTWGERSDGKPCVSSKCSWGAFHNMGYSVKDGAFALGSRGMGKALMLLAGNKTIVRTTLPDGTQMASEWEKKEDWLWRNAPELKKELTPPGTEIETDGVVDAVHESLIKFDGVVSELQERWFRPLEQGAQITYVLVKGGEKYRREVTAPRWPPLDTSQGEAKPKTILPKVVVKFYGEVLGELRDVHLFMAKQPFDPEDPTWGIAIVKNDKQTITRFRDFPPEIPDEIRRRIFGWCNAVCTEEKPFLRAAENSTHNNYIVSDTVYVYKAVKKELRTISRRLAEPFLGAGGEKVTEKEADEGKELLVMLNEALAAVPEFNLFGPGLDPPPPPPVERRDYIYLSRVVFEKRSYTRGEHVAVKAVIKNPTPNEVFVRANFEHYDPTPVVVGNHDDGTIIMPGTADDPATKEVGWDLAIDPTLAPGIHWIQVSLADVKEQPLRTKEGDEIKARHWLYVEVEPPTIARDRKMGEGGAKGFNNYQWFKKRELAETFEAYIDMSQMAAFVNRCGKRLEYAIQTSKSKRAYAPMIAQLVGEKIVEELLERDLNAKDAWKADEVRKAVLRLEGNRARFVREMIRVVNRYEGKSEKSSKLTAAEASVSG
jgi:hypothetical protein